MLPPLNQLANECNEVYNDYKVYKEMSSILSKISGKVQKNELISKDLDNLEEQLKSGEFHVG